MTGLACRYCNDVEGPFKRTGLSVVCERCISSSDPVTPQLNRPSKVGGPNGSAEVAPSGTGKTRSATSMYELLPVCETCGQPRVRIRVCDCGHEAVYHDEPGVGRCKIGAGLRNCGCARFSEATA